MDLSPYKFMPVIDLPKDYEIYDFSKTYDAQRELRSPFGVGKYNEKRPTMYDQNIFDGVRNIHMGIDIGAPVGTPLKNFYAGEVFLFGYNGQPGDYGHTLVNKYTFAEGDLWVLFGHLSHKSLEGKIVGQKIAAGEVMAWVGDKHENGGWNPHAHIQLSVKAPKLPDMPGVVSEENLQRALKDYPDPQIILGSLY